MLIRSEIHRAIGVYGSYGRGRIRRLSLRVCCVFLLGHAMLCPSSSEAQVATNITSSGLGTVVTPDGNLQNITGGTRNGSNLFHSFGLFNVGEGDIANFNNNTGLATSNILGRVNGGQISNIFGTIQTSEFGTANLFLINPAGWVFGPTATLDVGGAFRVTTADYIRFTDNAKFFADPAQVSALTSAPPAAFGFLGPMAAPITIDGSFLQVPDGQTLSIVGGDISITGGGLVVPGGRVEVASVASAGEVTLGGADSPYLGVESFAQLGTITMDGAFLDVSGETAGSIVIRGGNLMASNSFFQAAGFGDVDNATLGVDIYATEDVTLAASGIVTLTEGAGNGGGARIKAGGNAQVQEFSGINTLTFGVGAAGDIDIEAGSVTIADGSGLVSQTDGPGAAGDVSVKATSANSLVMSDGSSISNITTAGGVGGKIILSSPSMILDGGAVVITQSFGAGAGGDVVVEVGNLTLSGGAILKSESGGAPGGNIFVTATGAAMISGADSGIFSGGAGGAAGAPAGNISLTAGQLTLTTGGTIQNGTILDRAGNISVTATNSIVISDGGKILSQAFVDNVGDLTVSAPGGSLTMDAGLIQASTIQSGNAGNIAVDAATVSLTNGAQIVTSSAGTATGRGGNLTINATGSVSISGSSSGAPVSVLSGNDASSGLFSTASQRLSVAAQGGGQISVTTPSLVISDGGKISAFTPAAGPAGDITLATNAFSLVNGAQVVSSTEGSGQGGTIESTASNSTLISGSQTGLFSTASSTGPGGDITVQAPQIQMLNGATISADSTGTETATAGSVTLVTSDLNMQNSSITTGATLADGGDIKITTTGSLVNLTNSQITTSVQSGVGGGGNIAIDSDLVVLNDSRVLANAFGGPGGNINIVADVFLVNSGGMLPTSLAGIVDASSTLSTPGTINIEATFTDVSGEVAQLPETPLQATDLLRASCAARFAGGKASSLVLGGRDGVPIQPGGLLPSPVFTTDNAGNLSTGTKTSGNALPLRFSLLGPARNLTQYSLLPNEKCSF